MPSTNAFGSSRAGSSMPLVQRSPNSTPIPPPRPQQNGRASSRGDVVEQRLSLVTLGVTDVARSRAFYEALGWHGQEIEQTVFFQAGGMAVILWGREKLADDAGVPAGSPVPFGGIALAPRTLDH